MKGRRQKSQCEAGAFDISALGAGPEVRNRNGWVGFELSVEGRGGGQVMVYQSDLDQTVPLLNTSSLVFVKKNKDGRGHVVRLSSTSWHSSILKCSVNMALQP